MNSFIGADKNTSCSWEWKSGERGKRWGVGTFTECLLWARHMSGVLYTRNLHKNLWHGCHSPYLIDDDAGL